MDFGKWIYGLCSILIKVAHFVNHNGIVKYSLCKGILDEVASGYFKANKVNKLSLNENKKKMFCILLQQSKIQKHTL